jgi:hypothetical protein
MAVTRIVVTIDRLRLHGVAREDTPAIVAALQGELERSLARDTAGSMWASSAHAVLRPGSVRVGGGPHRTGRALGQAMATELVKGRAAT